MLVDEQQHWLFIGLLQSSVQTEISTIPCTARKFEIFAVSKQRTCVVPAKLTLFPSASAVLVFSANKQTLVS